MRSRFVLRLRSLVLSLLVTGCFPAPQDAGDAGRAPPVDAGDERADAGSSGTDAGNPEDAGSPRDAGAPVDAGLLDDPTCPALVAPPLAPLTPTPGELYYRQLGLGGFATGESALVVGPDGTLVLIDVGNDSHDDDVLAVLDDTIADMNAAGFATTPARTVDHIVITHFHADHGDALEPLLAAITVRGRVVHRGLTDLTPAANAATIERACAALASAPALGVGLCIAASDVSCADLANGLHPAVACPGLAAGNLALDDDTGPAFLALGAARLDVLAANGVIGGEDYATSESPLLTDDSNGENARSVVGRLQHGAFRLLFAGDLTGGGSDTDPVESFFAPRLPGVTARGVDVIHANHHGRDTSSSDPWVARLLPADGRDRNVIMGISTAHLNSPHDASLQALVGGDRLGEGRAWTTRVAVGGATDGALIDAGGGSVRVRTLDGGAAYFMQAVSAQEQVIAADVFSAVAACTP